jgi:hypothetical protein
MVVGETPSPFHPFSPSAINHYFLLQPFVHFEFLFFTFACPATSGELI